MSFALAGSVVVAGVILQILLSVIPVFHKNVANITKVIKDFRSRKYYRLWRSSRKTIIVSGKKNIMELSEASQLSQRAAYADIFGFRFTLNNTAHEEDKPSRFRFYGRLLQINGPGQLALIFPDLEAILEKNFAMQLNLNGSTANGWTSVKLATTMRKTVSSMMALAFFGPDLANNAEFRQALLDHPQNMVKSMGAFQVTPNFLAPLVHAIISKRGKAMYTILDFIIPEFARDPAIAFSGKPCIAHSMLELNPDPEYWTPEQLAQAILGIWFAAAHQPWMNLDFIMLQLCGRPEYIKELRAEIEDLNPSSYDDIVKLPLLDSFVKEVVRTTPLDSLAIRRKAMEPFRFSSGLSVKDGELVCISLEDAMHNEHTYPNPNVFDGWRFTKTTSKFTDVSEKYPVWGFGSLACPGRFHASLMIKMVLVHLISSFDFQFEDARAAKQWKWESFTMPFESTRVLFRRRTLQGM